MEKSLDQIISERPKNARRGSRRGGRAQVLGHSGPSPAAKARISANATAAAPTGQQPKTPKAASAPSQSAEKIIVSNLPMDVNEAQIKELFHSTVGPLKEVTLHYDSAGKSKGAAIIHFQRKGDANKAFTQYNNRLIDGKRPMKIEILVDPSRSQSLAERVAPAPAANAAAPAAPTNATQAPPRTGGGARRGRGRGRGGSRKNDRQPKTAADLDAEMEDYTGTTAPAAAAPAEA